MVSGEKRSCMCVSVTELYGKKSVCESDVCICEGGRQQCGFSLLRQRSYVIY